MRTLVVLREEALVLDECICLVGFVLVKIGQCFLRHPRAGRGQWVQESAGLGVTALAFTEPVVTAVGPVGPCLCTIYYLS